MPLPYVELPIDILGQNDVAQVTNAIICEKNWYIEHL